METFMIGTSSLSELLKIARKLSIIAPVEILPIMTEYTNQRRKGLQIDWIARKLEIDPRQLQAIICRESNRTIWPVDHFARSSTDLDAPVVTELLHHGMIPILAEQGRRKENERMGYIAVLAEHAFVAPRRLRYVESMTLTSSFAFQRS